MPRSLIAWLSGLIVSRGMSHVSEMMLATVSKVEDIVVPRSAMHSCALASRALRRGSPRLIPVKVGCPYSEERGQVQWRGQHGVASMQGWFPCKIACRAFLRIASATNATGRRSSVPPVNAMVSYSGRLSRNPLTVMDNLSWASPQADALRHSAPCFMYWLMYPQPYFCTTAAKDAGSSSAG